MIEEAEKSAELRTDETAVGIPPLDLQPLPQQLETNVYQLSDLIDYHDRAFVINAYRKITKRAPTILEVQKTLDELRSGRQTKTEIIDQLLKSYPLVKVNGLPSPTLRRIGRWPVIGYLMRWVRAAIRLPVLIQHQQRFEIYALAQHQRIADYLNEVVAPAMQGYEGPAPETATLQSTVADAVDAVMMLADSLVGMSAQQAGLLDRVQELQQQREQSEIALHRDLVALTEKLAALEQAQQSQLTTLRQEFQQQDVALTDGLREQQQLLAELRNEMGTTATSQREFLVEEQRLIVEAQHLAIQEVQTQVAALAAEQEIKRGELATAMAELRKMIQPLAASDQKSVAREFQP